MKKTQTTLIIIITLILLGGFAWIIYNNMPVRQLESQMEISGSTESTSDASSDVSDSILEETGGVILKPITVFPDENNVTTPSAEEGSTLTYSMDQVQAHASEEDCWTAINGEVYDLTSWISRHPGGPGAIINLCGNDGSAMFQRQHGRSNRAQSALALLKIGSLN